MNLIERQVDGAVVIGSAVQMTEKQKDLLDLVQGLGALIQLLLNRPNERWNVRRTRDALKSEKTYFSNTLKPAPCVLGLLNLCPKKKASSKF